MRQCAGTSNYRLTPPFKRACKIWSSASDIVPFNPRTNSTVCCISGSACHDPGRGEPCLRASGTRLPHLLASRGSLGGPPLSEWSPALLALALDGPSHTPSTALQCKCATVPGPARPTDSGRVGAVGAVSCRKASVSQDGRERRAE